jgi:bifunctional N-acetylglucosamine-1-phosphate-uridyltransferase/glucosamine-1-phosphate-acetyltransferase GlmU-like protein
MDTSLVILAAGIGSRYGGGIKQLEKVGPSGEIIMDYSIHDALEAGFNKVVFIIRKDLDADFRSIIGDRIAKVTHVEYAYQELNDVPAGCRVPEDRRKPWGTGQALLAAKDCIHEPFLVINADDYYGKEGFVKIHDYLVLQPERPEGAPEDICMAGFILGNTLSDNGGVTRGICLQDKEGHLTGIRETKNIIKTENGAGAAEMTDDGLEAIDPGSLVSMNMWGMQTSFLDELVKGFPEFLKNIPAGNVTAEYLLPNIVDTLLKSGRAEVSVLESNDRWFGVTYQEDRQTVKDEFGKLIAKGVYASPLFK